MMIGAAHIDIATTSGLLPSMHWAVASAPGLRPSSGASGDRIRVAAGSTLAIASAKSKSPRSDDAPAGAHDCFVEKRSFGLLAQHDRFRRRPITQPGTTGMIALCRLRSRARRRPVTARGAKQPGCRGGRRYRTLPALDNTSHARSGRAAAPSGARQPQAGRPQDPCSFRSEPALSKRHGLPLAHDRGRPRPRCRGYRVGTGPELRPVGRGDPRHVLALVSESSVG